MGLFDTVHYSQTPHPLTEDRIKKLITAVTIPYLKESDETLIQNMLITNRHTDSTISLQRIYELLTEAKNKNVISIHTRDAAMNVIKTYFDEYFPQG